MVSHKKKLRSEKAKIKLKGAKLPKGLNVTKTEFKVRKITLREQLKDAHGVNGQRQFNLKEVLSRLKHHSSGFRQDALRHLREAVTNGEANITGYMNELLQGVSAICLDIDKETRRDSFKALNCLMSTLSVGEVAPFFHIISSYLRCAMTHIQLPIQEDSLLMLDVLLQHVPSLVTTNSTKIFQNFLEMISRVRNEGDRISRTLTVRLGSKQTTVKWRTKVLERLQQMLTTLINHKYSKREENFSTTAEREYQCLTYTFKSKAPQYFSLKRPYSKNASFDYLTLFGRSVGDIGKSGDTLEIDESQSLQSYVKHLMPLLIDTWLEVRPQEQAVDALLSSEAAQTLKVVLEIMEKLWIMVDSYEKRANIDEVGHWFQNEYADSFSLNFLTACFPFQQKKDLDLKNKRKGNLKSFKDNKLTDDQLCLQQNIYLSYLMCRFCRTPQSGKIVILLEYIIQIVSNLSTHPMQNYRPLTVALRIFLVKNGLVLLDIHPSLMRSLLNVTITAFLQNEFPSKDGAGTQVLTLLCEIVQIPDMQNRFGEEEFTRFLKYLPQLLLKPTINVATLTAMSNLCKQKNSIILNSLEQQIENVIENIQKIQVVGAQNAFEGKKLVMNLFYWTNNKFSVQHETKLLQKVEECVTDKRIVNYFKFVIIPNE